VKFQVKLFAVARQLVGQPAIEIDAADLADPAADPATGLLPTGPPGSSLTVGQLREAIRKQYPVLIPTLERVVFAVNSAYASEQTVVSPSDEIACIPPVSGG
jgi:molybdopterin converting factor small subunit